MGKGRKGSGVEIRPKSIRVNFTWNDERCRETLDLKPTPPNVRYAERLMKEINEKIAAGTFVYADYFPESPRAQLDPKRTTTIEDMGQAWLKTKGRLASATLSQYGNALKFWYGKLDRKADITEVKHSTIAAIVGEHEWPSPKLCNNYLIPLRGLFALALKDHLIASDPMVGIENSPMQDPIPDPFTIDEAEAILAHLFKHYPETIGNYFQFAFFGAMRPEEEIAFMWSDMDWQLGQGRVQRARSFRGELKDVKNYQARDVELLGRAIEALNRQKALTLMKQHGFVFENPVTGKPWHDERSQRDHYWKPALKHLGIRYRTPYHTRHTFATVALMNDCNPAWVAKQMGNSPRVIYKHYAKWIEQADRSRQRNKLEAAIRSKSEQFVPNLSPAANFAGRRDWTRTNDPHHVKVVL